MGTFFGSVIIGYVYAAFKLLAATKIVMKEENKEKCLWILFVDILTQEAAKHAD